jgi:hypothetical protein
MIQQRNAQQIPNLSQSFGQESVFLTGRTVSRGMIMGACDVKSL